MNKEVEVRLTEDGVFGKITVMKHVNGSITLKYPVLTKDGRLNSRRISKKFAGDIAHEISEAISKKSDRLASGITIMDAVNYIHLD